MNVEIGHGQDYGPYPSPLEAQSSRCLIQTDPLPGALEKAERGEISGIRVIMRRPDGTWCDERSRVVDFPEAIGRLKIVKQSWIATYLGFRKE
jgi:hypothetical protein